MLSGGSGSRPDELARFCVVNAQADAQASPGFLCFFCLSCRSSPMPGLSTGHYNTARPRAGLFLISGLVLITNLSNFKKARHKLRTVQSLSQVNTNQ